MRATAVEGRLSTGLLLCVAAAAVSLVARLFLGAMLCLVLLNMMQSLTLAQRLCAFSLLCLLQSVSVQLAKITPW
jgi:hypothetical protein